MKKAGLTDQALRQAVAEMTQGLIDADLGGGVVKKRVALPGRGKRGGARIIVATRFRERWFFLYGFVKNERATINQDELRAFQELARTLLGFTDREIATALSSNEIFEVTYGNEKA
ncbi:MAG: type II toxin-antitoxin system RelE/ParE family toxin [Gammaproteobacteria bacterium]